MRNASFTPRKTRNAQPVRSGSPLEELLLIHLRDAGLPEPEREYRFHKVRQWRLDFAYAEYKLGIEVQGGTYSGGRHSGGTGQDNDFEKINYAQMMGWIILQFSSKQIRSGEAIAFIQDAMKHVRRGEI